MIVDCPSCDTTFPVDPNKVPDGGVHARCSVCSDVFFVDIAEPETEPAGVLAADLETHPGEEWAAVDEDAYDTVEAGVEESFEVPDDLIPDADEAVATETEPDWAADVPEVEEEDAWEAPTPPEPEAEVVVEQEEEPSWMTEEAEAAAVEEEPPVGVEEEPAWTAVEEPSWMPEEESGPEVEAITEIEEQPLSLEEEPTWVADPPVEVEVELEEEEEPVFEAGLPVDFLPEDPEPVDVDEEAELAEEAFEVEPFYPPGADLEPPPVETPSEEPVGTGEIELQEDAGDWVADDEDAFGVGEAPFMTEPETEIEAEPEAAESDQSFEPEGFVEGETPFLAETPVDSWPPSAEEPAAVAEEPAAVAEEPAAVAEDLVPDTIEAADAVEAVVEEPFEAADDFLTGTFDTVAEPPAVEELIEEATEAVADDPLATGDALVSDAVEAVADDPLAPGDALVSDAVEAVADDPLAPGDALVSDAVPSPPTPSFGRRDPEEKAQRLARVLVSDIILYNPDRHQQASETGRIKEEFEDEIQKSWHEYVEQVGEDVANNTSHFTDALNEILARGEQVF